MEEDLTTLEILQEEMNRERAGTAEALRSSLHALKTDLSKQCATETQSSTSAILDRMAQMEKVIAEQRSPLSFLLRVPLWLVGGGWLVAVFLLLCLTLQVFRTWDWKERLLPRTVGVVQTKDGLEIPLGQWHVGYDPKTNHVLIQR